MDHLANTAMSIQGDRVPFLLRGLDVSLIPLSVFLDIVIPVDMTVQYVWKNLFENDSRIKQFSPICVNSVSSKSYAQRQPPQYSQRDNASDLVKGQISEWIQTEASYVKKLGILCTVYRTELAAAIQRRPFISEFELGRIFYNVESIWKTCADFSRALQSYLAHSGPTLEHFTVSLQHFVSYFSLKILFVIMMKDIALVPTPFALCSKLCCCF